jgi:hypothetical protein
MEAVVLALVVSMGGVTASWFLTRRKSSAETYHERAEGDEIYMRSAQQAWAEIKELRRWQQAATPILLKCAEQHPELRVQMDELKLLNGGTR